MDGRRILARFPNEARIWLVFQHIKAPSVAHSVPISGFGGGWGVWEIGRRVKFNPVPRLIPVGREY